MVDRGFVTSSCKLLIGIDRLTTFLSEAAVDEVLFTDVVSVMRDVEEMVTRCSEQGVRTSLVADLFNMGMFRSELSYFGSVPLVHYQTPPGDGFDLAVKRLFDIVTSAVLLMVLAPLFAIIAIAVRTDSPGPILFKQRRVGLNGRIFSLYKFRSMQLDAEAQLSALRKENEMQGPAFKLRNDPRVTPVGRFIRRHSLDELPQLWNVFRGDMSLVGPRPPMPDEVQLYDRKERRRLSMRPGLTCTWQVSGRNDIADFESWVQLDLEYIDNWSLGLDFSLLVRTVPAVVFGSGAR
jgi:exopolysaccharide biosynthesis polyprenyl glycosylphosphotransferase